MPSKRTNASTKTITPTAHSPPTPFSLASSKLTPFLSTLSKTSVYITHIDPHPAPFKRRIFAVPVLLNLTIALLLLWRLSLALPFYYSLLLSTLGLASPATVDTASKSWPQLIGIVLRRSATFLVDFLLCRLIVPWPITFFLERPANPVSWRWRFGFADRELYVRVSRGWGAEDLLRKERAVEENPFWKVRVLPAVAEERMRGKTGYLLMDKNWDLDFGAMIKGTEAVGRGQVRLEDLDGVVLAWDEELGWLSWRLPSDERATEERETANAEEGSEEARRIAALKHRLTGMGKERLFFRWIELVQYSSTQPGNMTPERLTYMLKRASDAFEKEGVNFQEFLASIGGISAMPGMNMG